MLGWVLIGIVVFIIVLLIVLRVLNKKPEVTRMSIEKSKFQKFLDACCRHKHD